MKITAKTVDVDGENIQVTCDHEGFDGADVYVVPLRALADRMLVYGLETEEEALDACLREHVVRLAKLEPQGARLHEQIGGLHSGVTVAYTASARSQRAKTLESESPMLHRERVRRGLPPRNT